MSNRAAAVGTSPHGLSVDLPVAHQETLGAPFCPLSAKPLLTSPEAYRTAKVQDACSIIQAAAAKQSSGFFGVTLTQEQCKHLAFAVLCQVEGLIESHEADEPEVQEALRCLQEFQGNLKRAAKRHAYKTGQAKGAKNTRWRTDHEHLSDKEAEL